MSPEPIFQIHLVLGYVAWLLCFGVYVWPWLKSMDRFEAQRAIATLHSSTYAIPIIYVPVLMITHLVAFYFLARPSGRHAAE